MDTKHATALQLESQRKTLEELSLARNPDLRNSLIAMQRAGELARKTAIDTNTGIVTMRDGKMVFVSADELRREDLLKKTEAKGSGNTQETLRP